MKVLPVSNTNFKAIYVNNFDYNYPQQYAISNIFSSLNNENLEDIAAKGYDVFIESNPDCKDEVSVSLIKNFKFTDECAVKECRKIKVGNYGAEELNSEFRIDDIYNKISDFQKQMISMDKFGKIMFLLIAGTLLALAATLGIKHHKIPKFTNAEKAATEMTQTFSK